MTTQYIFEKIRGEMRWQARINGEFVCYVGQTHGGQYYSDDLGWIVYGESKSDVVDNVLEALNMNEKLTEAQLAEIEARLAAATPGPWQAKGQCVDVDGEYEWAIASGSKKIAKINDFRNTNDITDAHLIANAPTDLAALCAALREAWAENERLRDALSKVTSLQSDYLNDSDIVFYATETAKEALRND